MAHVDEELTSPKCGVQRPFVGDGHLMLRGSADGPPRGAWRTDHDDGTRQPRQALLKGQGRGRAPHPDVVEVPHEDPVGGEQRRLHVADAAVGQDARTIGLAWRRLARGMLGEHVVLDLVVESAHGRRRSTSHRGCCGT